MFIGVSARNKLYLILPIVFLISIAYALASDFTFYQINGGTVNNDTALVSAIDSNPSNAPIDWNTRYVKIVANNGISYNSGDKLNLFIKSGQSNKNYYVHDATGNITYANFTISTSYDWRNITLVNTNSVSTLYISDLNESGLSNLFTDYAEIKVNVPTTLNIYLDNYFVSNNVNILLSSSLINTQHTLQLYNSTGNLFCDKNITSPSVAYTQFSTQCLMPQNAQIGSALFYRTNDKSKNITGNFNIINKAKNPNQIQISRIYYSQQVLQGSSTEIFALVVGNVTSISAVLTYPDNSMRSIMMNPTGNAGEYRAFITDTYKTGTVIFDIKAISGNYYDDYINSYDVVPYNTDFVEIINAIARIYNITNKPKLEVHGTEYQIGQEAKVWLQLLDSGGNDVITGVCYADMYTPSGGYYFEKATMINMVHDGIYYYDFSVPVIEGVYPVIAECYYNVVQNFYYPTTYSLSIGSVDGAFTASNFWSIDTVYNKFKEAKVGGVSRLDVVLNVTNVSSCRDIPEALLTGLTVDIYGSFDSVVNDNIQISIFNFTGNKWIPLPNKLQSNGILQDVSNTLTLNNVTKSGIYVSGTGMKLRFNDTTITDGTDSKLSFDQVYISCNQLANPEWQQVKGSSEVHVNPSYSGSFSSDMFLFSLCGDENTQSLSSGCEQFRFTNYTGVTSNFSDPEGWLYEEVTVINARQRDFTNSIFYETPSGQDCTGVLDITSTNDANVTTSIIDDVNFQSGFKIDNCILEIPISMLSTETRHTIKIYQQNYMVWEVNRDKRFIDFYRTEPETYCHNLETTLGFNMTVPIHSNLSNYNDPILKGCWQTLDDLYWFDYYIDVSKGIITSGDYESMLAEVRFYYPEIIQEFSTVINIETKDIQLFDVQTICEKESDINLPEDDTHCQFVKPADGYYSSVEGWILANLTIVNKYGSSIKTSFLFETADDVDCSAVLDIQRVSSNGTITNILNQSILHGGTIKNCEITLPINFVNNENSFDILIKQINFIEWNILQMNDKVNSIRNTTTGYCSPILANVSYSLPISISLNYITNPNVKFCLRAMDDLYIWDYVYASLPTHRYLYETLTDYYEYQYLYPFIFDADEIVLHYESVYNANLAAIAATNASIAVSDAKIAAQNAANAVIFAPQMVWNYTNRNLTYYPNIVNATVIGNISAIVSNLQDIANAVTNDSKTVFIGATEYSINTTGKIAVRLIKGTSELVTGATCRANILYPNSSFYINNTLMSEFGEGVYYYNFNVPSVLGVYTYYTNCLKIATNYYGLSTFHVSNLATNDSMSTINSKLDNITMKINSVLSELTLFENYLLSLTTSSKQMSQFSEEQIYLITDSITNLQNIRKGVTDGSVTPEDADKKMSDIKQRLLTNKMWDTPNEIYIELVKDNCIAFITNEGKVQGEYQVTMQVEGYRKTQETLILGAGEASQVSISLAGLEPAKYTCSAVSEYDGGKGSAKKQVFYDIKDDSGSLGNSIQQTVFDAQPAKIINNKLVLTIFITMMSISTLVLILGNKTGKNKKAGGNQRW
jgi:hypothetical protein